MTSEIYETTIRFLEPKRVRITRNSFGKLLLEIGEERHEGIKLTRSFPHTSPDAYISLADADGKEIGMLEHLKDVDRTSHQILEEELALTYFSPTIQRIRKVVQHYGATSWHVETDRGPQIVRVRERGDIRWLSHKELVLTDVHGIRYQIPDASELDEESRFLLEQET